MKAKKVILLLVFPIIAEVAVSCCDCLESETKHYSNKTMSVQNLDNSGSQPQVLSSNSVVKSAYGIRVHLSREKTAYNTRHRSVFLQSAYAFKCGCPPPIKYLPRDTVTAIRIFTLRDFDAGHLANADISNYFKVYQQFSFNTIPEYLKQAGLVLFEEAAFDTQADLLLMTPPAMNTKHKFKVQMVLSDGRVLEQETPEIDLI